MFDRVEDRIESAAQVEPADRDGYALQAPDQQRAAEGKEDRQPERAAAPGRVEGTHLQGELVCTRVAVADQAASPVGVVHEHSGHRGLAPADQVRVRRDLLVGVRLARAARPQLGQVVIALDGVLAAELQGKVFPDNVAVEGGGGQLVESIEFHHAIYHLLCRHDRRRRVVRLEHESVWITMIPGHDRVRQRPARTGPRGGARRAGCNAELPGVGHPELKVAR